MISTHALIFKDSVQFSKLGLVIVDKQHRFGIGVTINLTQQTEGRQDSINR